MALTTDPNNPDLQRGVDTEPTGQHEVYLVLPDEQLQTKIRPYRDTYVHDFCGTATTMGRKIAETYQVNPHFYGSTYCVGCQKHLPVTEFIWSGTTEKVGS